ncbi:Nitrogen fixation protein VnfA [Planctopirus ephydatiae]|uniref:Nitrogen fixation protein VnfA n=1 Tax=Planctopirus ephydatiae TaxID=2528019 RepID=A0A518GTU8_9PLAN|nr:sigma-54-dependent Fis family transcriptional regulator [Planctopirus ephydatiae]QDV32018.1 Nitrogen fixation protein VnfA [Planctopirus ephydatiae]
MASGWLSRNEFRQAPEFPDLPEFSVWQQEVFQLLPRATSIDAFGREVAARLAGLLGVSYVAIWQRSPAWASMVQYGRLANDDLPQSLMIEALDRDAATIGVKASGSCLVAPLPQEDELSSLGTAVLVIHGKNLHEKHLPAALFAAQTFATALAVCQKTIKAQERAEKLREILKLAAQLANEQQTEKLLTRIAEEATRLLDCDRASIFIWDREHHEVIACPALGVEGGSLRLSDKVGVVGEVISKVQLIRVDDAYADPRFHRKVDASSGYKTSNLLCGPLRDLDGKVLGAFEVINHRQGPFSQEDEITLLDLCIQIAAALQNTRERELLVTSNRQLTEQVSRGVNIVGESPAIVAMRSTIRRLAGTDLPVLILGESGTGKEVVASSLHYQGSRADRPFIAVNCAALTETLLESELFGHERGSFTDAHEMRRGKFELAEGGTIFLDEIGDLSAGGQAKLLRVLEQKVITRVGGSQTIPINARVIAATNARLAEAVRAKKFREDLYFRLNVVTLEIPPLRERADDVLPLAEYFLEQFAVQARRGKMHLSAEARRRLQSHAWPGNVRELRNLMERVAFLAPAERIEVEDLAFILSPERDSFHEPSLDMGLSEATNSFQQEYIRRAIKRVRNNMSEAARLLGLHRSNLYRKMRQLDMAEAGDGDEESDS